jgi:site-specific DNA recombinase
MAGLSPRRAFELRYVRLTSIRDIASTSQTRKRFLFRRYLGAGSVVRLKQQLDAEGFRIPIRLGGAGRSTGGGLLSRGHVYKLLSNPIYVGRIAHKGQVHEGQHPPIVMLELWDEVQQSLRDHTGAARTRRTRQSSPAKARRPSRIDAADR